ncbi:paraquat-inducible membrane protein A [Rhodosalinus halophilus]|uniref:Paraquat-inducible membrane protein A n=1 Tax=Rhodosalinus halophilus TaxID=2259333 RepID=A0A365U6Y8_9RHOB|nr:paraquat-inducible protein A [Rhodosalinus halophilus]RBI83893.1 paraquat-inducible membrane protein A [Rhodosalinus halophilus]
MGLRRTVAPRWLVAVNLALLLLYPVAWSAPLLRAGLLPLFGMSEISVLSGLAALWDNDRALAVVVALFALVAPYAKTLGLAARHFGLLSARWAPALEGLGRLAMADIFLIAIYITVARGIGVGRVEVAWGLYLFTLCILASLAISLAERRLTRPHPASASE